MQAQFGTLKKAFVAFDEQDETHLITYRKWSHTLKQYFNGEARWTPSQRREMFLYIDVDNSGKPLFAKYSLRRHHHLHRIQKSLGVWDSDSPMGASHDSKDL
jgi:hypothetical protein